MSMMKNGMRPVHPGEVLLEEFMKPAEPPINANMLAKAGSLAHLKCDICQQ
jgi:plasmid maintenance system antidote protein VapI